MSHEDEAPLDAEPPLLAAFIERASPSAGLDAQRTLASLEARLFGRQAGAVTVDRYVLAERIASGGGGTIYRAHDPELDRQVAIKLLHTGHEANRPEGRARLVREAQLLARLAHPNIIEIYDVGTYQTDLLGRPLSTGAGDAAVFIAMQHVAGSNLAAWLAEKRRPWTEVRDVFMAAGRGLAAAHARGLVHRDFKPANVMVGRRPDGGPDVRVLDFGLGCASGAAAGAPNDITPALQAGLDRLGGSLDVSLTMTGAMLGTPAYMAPEQHAGERADARSDQYSFCLALYEGLYSCSPFGGLAAAELEEAKKSGSVLPPPAGTKVPIQIERALSRGLSPDPAARWPDMNTLLEALGRPAARHRPELVAGLAVAIGLAGAVGAQWWPTSARGPCDDADERLNAVWNDRRADAVRATFMATGVPFAPTSFERARSRIDAYADAWSAAVAANCHASERSERRTAASHACLDERLEQLAAAVDALSAADAITVEHAIDTVGDLPTATSCEASETRAQRPRGAAPPGPETARRALETARTLAADGRAEEALEHVSEARAALVALHGPTHPLRVELELVNHELQDGTRPSEREWQQLASILALGEEVYGERHPRTASLRERLGHALHRAGRHGEARDAFEAALRDLDDGVRGPDRLAPLWIGLGEVELTSGRPEQARISFERALQARDEHSGPERLAAARFGLARALWETGLTDAGVTELAVHARDAYAQLEDRDAVARVEAWMLAHTLQ